MSRKVLSRTHSSIDWKQNWSAVQIHAVWLNGVYAPLSVLRSNSIYSKNSSQGEESVMTECMRGIAAMETVNVPVGELDDSVRPKCVAACDSFISVWRDDERFKAPSSQ